MTCALRYPQSQGTMGRRAGHGWKLQATRHPTFTITVASQHGARENAITGMGPCHCGQRPWIASRKVDRRTQIGFPNRGIAVGLEEQESIRYIIGVMAAVFHIGDSGWVWDTTAQLPEPIDHRDAVAVAWCFDEIRCMGAVTASEILTINESKAGTKSRRAHLSQLINTAIEQIKARPVVARKNLFRPSITAGTNADRGRLNIKDLAQVETASASR